MMMMKGGSVIKPVFGWRGGEQKIDWGYANR
jgi:hypothetical protein